MMQPMRVSQIHFQYEHRVQVIYAFDVWSYHILTYTVYDPKIWNDLPPVAYDSPFWYLGVFGLIIWAMMVVNRASDGLLNWKRTPHDLELALWFFGCIIIHPIFFFLLARYSNQMPMFMLIAIYRMWSFRTIGLFVQEVWEKGQLLQLRRQTQNRLVPRRIPTKVR